MSSSGQRPAALDTGRLRAARAEIAVLRRRVEELERAPLRRALTPLRRLAHTLLPRHPSPPEPPPAPGRGLVLVVDNAWPRPEHDAGSVDIFHLLRALGRFGFTVRLGALSEHEGPQPARDWLQAAGIACLTPADAPSVPDWLARHGNALDLCVLCRVFAGGSLLEQVQRDAPYARLIFATLDLNYLREERRARVLGDDALLGQIASLRAREEHVIRASDLSLVVSRAEQALLAQSMPDCAVVHTPLAREVRPPVHGFAERSGAGFVGGFAHLPNADAMAFFLADIWPTLRARLPGATLAIAGADPPAGLAGPGVQVQGHVPDLDAWLEGLRLTVAPLRFGAGAKGKVASSLAAGVPCVATSVAAEGMDLAGGDGVLVCDDPAEFAAAMLRLHEDGALWARMSAGALAYAERTLSLGAWEAGLDAALRGLGL